GIMRCHATEPQGTGGSTLVDWSASMRPSSLSSGRRNSYRICGQERQDLGRLLPMPSPWRAIWTIALLLTAVVAAPAQPYPNRPIRLIVGFPPGGAVDIIARIYAQGLSTRLGQPVVVENKPGTGGNLASDMVAKAAPDGYTLLHSTENVFISNPHV